MGRESEEQMDTYHTLSEMWAGQFGQDYLDRHAESNRENFDKRCRFMGKLYGKALAAAPQKPPEKVLEVGCGDGQNLLSIMDEFPNRLTTLFGADVSQEALDRLHPKIHQIHAPAHDLSSISDNEFDIVFTCGLLIHIHPDDLTSVYRELWRVTKHVLFIAEYFSVQPLSIRYQGEHGILWKRDFGGELLKVGKEDEDESNDSINNITVVDYGHEFKSMGGYEDLGWWIFKKEQR